MKAIILAAGDGTNLSPFSDTRPINISLNPEMTVGTLLPHTTPGGINEAISERSFVWPANVRQPDEQFCGR